MEGRSVCGPQCQESATYSLNLGLLSCHLAQSCQATPMISSPSSVCVCVCGGRRGHDGVVGKGVWGGKQYEQGVIALLWAMLGLQA